MDRNQLKDDAIKLIERCKELSELDIANPDRESDLRKYIIYFKELENLTNEEQTILEELEKQLRIEKNIRPHNEFEQMEARQYLAHDFDFPSTANNYKPGNIAHEDEER